MNLPAFLIASGVGATFFVAGYGITYQPDFIKPSAIFSTFSTEHMKARAAVRRALIDPDSAKFDALRSVQTAGARYVCGAVKASNGNGGFAEAVFVYSVSLDSTGIDDGGRITRQHSSFRPCPSPGEDATEKPDLTISPGALSMAKTIQKIAPKSDASALSTLKALMPADGTTSGHATMEQQIGQLAGRAAIASDQMAGQQINSTSKSGPGSAGDWRGDQPPAVWPTFPSGHPMAKSTRQRTTSEALALAKDVENRWQRSETFRDATVRPSSEEIKEACRALLTIDPMDPEYRRAWAVFVRLQDIDRRVAMN